MGVSLRVFTLLALVAGMAMEKKHHHHRHHRHHHHSAVAVNSTQQAAKAAKDASVNSTEAEIMSKMKELEKKMGGADAAAGGASGVKEGRIIVNGPLPTDFTKVFANAVAEATGCDPNSVQIKESHPVAVSFIQVQSAKATNMVRQEVSTKGDQTVEVVFDAPTQVVDEVEKQAADAESKLVNGQLHAFLVADEDDSPPPAEEPAAAPRAPDVDTEMPYGELEPFGREDTAQELTDQSIQESDEMVDQLERAEVAEEKRSVFRALTRLRGAAITSFDGIARSQTGNIDEYNHVHKWRQTHPLHHLADEESDVSKWAFPDNAD